MHDIGFVDTIFMIFLLWTGSTYSFIKKCPQWAAVLPTHLMFWKRQNSAPVQLTYASRAIMHDFGLVETIIMVFRPWTVSSYSNIEKQPPVISCAPDALNTLYMAKFCNSSIGLSQQSHHARYWVCRDYIYDFPILNSFFLFLYKKDGCPQWAAVHLPHLMFSKRQNLAPVQSIYASGPMMHDIGFVETIIMVFRLLTVYPLS